jgi:hypothetical protein
MLGITNAGTHDDKNAMDFIHVRREWMKSRNPERE